MIILMLFAALNVVRIVRRLTVCIDLKTSICIRIWRRVEEVLEACWWRVGGVLASVH